MLRKEVERRLVEVARQAKRTAAEASATTASLRAQLNELQTSSDDAELEQEVEIETSDRLDCIAAVIRREVRVAIPDVPAIIPHPEALRRNVASHAFGVRGVGSMHGAELRKAQHGRLSMATLADRINALEKRYQLAIAYQL